MILFDLYLGGFAYSFSSIALVGLAWLCLLRRFRIFATDLPSGHVLAALSLGFYWAALAFMAIYLPGFAFAHSWKIKLGLDIGVILLALLAARRELVSLLAEIIRSPLSILLPVAALAGTWAFFTFPHTLDSSQLKSVQTLLLRGSTSGLAMWGYSGLAAFCAQLFESFPVVVVAATFKPLLSILAAGVAYHAVSMLELPRRGLNAAILFSLVMLSYVGAYGVMELGKDSIFGVLFSFAFLVTLCWQDAPERGTEMGLYFGAAAATGIIAVPYMLAAYAIWILVSPAILRSAGTIKNIYLVNLPILPFAASGFLGIDPLVVFGAYLLIGIGGGAAVLVFRKWDLGWETSSLRMERFYFPILLGLILCCVALMPAALGFEVWKRADGSPVIEMRPPLDGQTSFLHYLLAYPVQTPTVALGILSTLALMLSRFGRTRPGLFALAAMPFAVLLGLLIRVHLKLPLLSDFNIWDLTKDIPQWYGGLLFSMALLIGANKTVAALVPWRFQGFALAVLAVASVAWPLSHGLATRYAQPVTYTSIGGFQDPDKAALTEILWKNFQEAPVYIDPDARVGALYFYDQQMFGPNQINWYDTASIGQVFSVCCQKVGLIVGKDKMPSLEALASQNHATIHRLATLDAGRTDVVSVVMDGTRRNDSFTEAGQARILSGLPRNVTARGRSYQWMALPGEIEIESTQARSCVILRAFNAPQSKSRRTLRLQLSDGSGGTVNLAGTNSIHPREIRIPLQSADKVRIQVSGEKTSPTQDDRRPTNYSIVLPVTVAPAEACDVNRVELSK